MAMIKSLPSVASLGVAATLAPDAASFLAGSGVRFQTVSSWPALSRFVAIREPIAPSPRNAILLTLASCRPNGRRLKLSVSFRSFYITKLDNVSYCLCVQTIWEPRRNGDFVDSQSFYRCLVVRSVARSEHHHTSPNNLALPEQLKLLAD